MNRLEKRCAIASAAFHGLLAGVVLFGAALTPKQTPALNRFTLVTLPTDGLTTSDSSTEEATSQPQTQPETGPAAKKSTLSPSELTKVSRNDPTPVKKPVDNSRVKKAVADVLHNITNGVSTSGAVSISPAVGAGPAMANYGDLIYSRYRAAWIPPLGLEDESISVTATVTIARNGQVLLHEITKRSGNAAMDASIDSTLENVTFIEAFPAGSTDSQRTFTIKFTPGRNGQ